MTEPAAPTERTEPTLDSTTRADQSDELATTTMLRGAIGSINTDYYLKLFTRFDAQDRAGASWNTAAAFATLNWMLFRKMWNTALAYCGMALTAALLVFGIGDLAFHYAPEVRWALAGLYALLLVLIPGLWGNALLFRQVRSAMAGALSANQSIAEAAALLLSRAPTRKRLLVLALLNAVLGGLVLALVLWAKDFQGLSGAPSAADPSTTAPAPAPAPAASGNLAVGKALEASTPAPVASGAAQAVSAPASAPQATTSAPASASLPAGASSTPGPMAKPATTVASAPAASAPATAASTPSKVLPAAAPAKTTSAPAAATPASAPATTRKQATPAAGNSAEKVEAAKLAPRAAAQTSKATAPAGASKPLPTPRQTAPSVDEPERPGVPVGQYGINVGLFANDNNARNAFVKLSDAGFMAYTQELQGKKGKLTRVRVGPFDSLAQAERSAAQIRALGLDALVFQQAAPTR